MTSAAADPLIQRVGRSRRGPRASAITKAGLAMAVAPQNPANWPITSNRPVYPAKVSTACKNGNNRYFDITGLRRVSGSG
jgi:hypothetical protein